MKHALPIIRQATVSPDAHHPSLDIEYDDGTTVTVDLSPIIAVGGVLGRLADRAFLAQVKIGPQGRSLEWPGEIDLCADALREQGRIVSRSVA